MDEFDRVISFAALYIGMKKSRRNVMWKDSDLGYSLDGTSATFTPVSGQLFVFTENTVEYLIGGAAAGKWNYVAVFSTDGNSDVTFTLSGPSDDIWCFINMADGSLLIYDVGLGCFYHCTKA